MIEIEALYAEARCGAVCPRFTATERGGLIRAGRRIRAMIRAWGEWKKTKGFGSEDERKAAYFAILQLAQHEQRRFRPSSASSSRSGEPVC